MPKRKRKLTRDDFDYLSKKLRNLQRKIKGGRSRHHRSVSSTDTDSSSPHKQQESELITGHDDYTKPNENPQPGCSYWDLPATPEEIYDVPTPIQSPNVEEQVLPSTSSVQIPAENIESAPLLEVEPNMLPHLLEVNEPEQSSTNQPSIQELDPELMEILGEDPTSHSEFGNEIQKDLAIRLNHIATSGLSKEIRRELKERYLVPSNCKFIKAPILNPELRASLVESETKRDKGFESKQTLTSCALSSLSEAITHLLSSGHKDPKLLKLLMDTARTLGDIQYMDSNSRRIFILSTLKKELKEHLEKTKIEEMLFGNNLTDTLKFAKTIIQSGADLRSSSTMKSTVLKPAKGVNKPLNHRAPPGSRRQPPQGDATFVRPTPSIPMPKQTARTTQNNGSKTSSRQPPTLTRR